MTATPKKFRAHFWTAYWLNWCVVFGSCPLIQIYTDVFGKKTVVLTIQMPISFHAPVSFSRGDGYEPPSYHRFRFANFLIAVLFWILLIAGCQALYRRFA